ncbi:unnamed protein product [Scytosiphon promiscuus]
MMPVDGAQPCFNSLRGMEERIFTLMQDRATPEQWADWLRAPLEHAVGSADKDLVGKLLKAGANGGAGWRGCDGKTLLHAGVEGGDEVVMTALIKSGGAGDLDIPTIRRGRTPLHFAAIGGNAAASRALILAGADINVLDANDDGPLHLAIENGHAAVAEYLLIGGADPRVKGSHGAYPVHLATHRGQDGVLRCLVHKGVDLDCLNADGKAPLRIAVDAGHVSTMEILLEGGADVNLRTSSRTVLHAAAHHNKADAVEVLVRAGANIEARDNRGLTPLWYSAFHGSCAAMLSLLRMGAEVLAKSDLDTTPLHVACHKGEADAANLLLRWGADETAVSSLGKTPSSWIPDIAKAAEEDRPRLERLSKLLANAPQDRNWRRRGFIVMCRAYPDKLRREGKSQQTAVEAIGGWPARPASTRRARRGRVKIELGSQELQGSRGGTESSSKCGERRAARTGDGGGFDVLVAWLVVLRDEDVFRKIIGFV